jgi:protein-S-isoprenylcysteine O-methyltransferase Ste14
MPASSPSADGPGRGGGWVAAQFVLLAAVALSAIVGLGWTGLWLHAAIAVAGVVGAVGLVLVVGGSLGLGSAMTPFPRPREGGRLIVEGLYAHARHPIYGGVLLLSVAWSLAFASIAGAIFTVALAVLFVFKSRREEEWLVERYPRYAEYRARVRRRFLPFLL